MSSFNKKVLVIGLDGAVWDLLDEILENDYMPYLKKLKNESAYGILNSTIPPISSAAWATISTGREPLDLNIYSFQFFDKNEKKAELVSSNLIENPIWEILNKVGKKVAIINIPLTYPVKKINGYIVSGMLTPSIESSFTYPENLKKKILEKIPDYQIKYSENIQALSTGLLLKKFIQDKIKNIKDQAKICLNLIYNDNIDFLMINFQANDFLQHALWGFMEKSHDLHRTRIKEYIFTNFYRTLDLAIEAVRETFISKTNNEVMTIILSDHGFEAHNKSFLLGDWLYQNRFLIIKENISKRIGYGKFIGSIYSKIIQIPMIFHLLNKYKLEMKNKKSTNKRINKFDFFNVSKYIDWENTFVYSMDYNLYGLIFIMKKSDEYYRILQVLKKKLIKLKDPENNLKIVDKVYLKHELYHGDKPERIPDLIIKPIKGYSFDGVFRNNKKYFKKIELNKDYQIGKHSEEGIIIINCKSVSRKKIKSANLKDIVPTILNYFNIPIPSNLKGKILGL